MRPWVKRNSRRNYRNKTKSTCHCCLSILSLVWYLFYSFLSIVDRSPAFFFRVNLQLLKLLFQLERLGFQLNVNLMRNRTDCYSILVRERMPKNRVYLRACIHTAYFINLFQPRWFYLISTFLYPRCGPVWLVTWSRNTFAFVAYTYWLQNARLWLSRLLSRCASSWAWCFLFFTFGIHLRCTTGLVLCLCLVVLWSLWNWQARFERLYSPKRKQRWTDGVVLRLCCAFVGQNNSKKKKN